jgi:hypothetical protein
MSFDTLLNSGLDMSSSALILFSVFVQGLLKFLPAYNTFFYVIINKQKIKVIPEA